MKRNFYYIFLAFVLTACSNHKEEIKQVEDLETRLNSLTSTFNNVDMPKVEEAIETYEENMSMIRKYNQKDTIEIEYGNTLNKYKGIEEESREIKQLKTNCGSDLKKMKTALSNLKTDIENNVWEEDSIKNFIEFESEKLDELGENIGTFILKCQYIIDTHDSLADKIKSYTLVF